MTPDKQLTRTAPKLFEENCAGSNVPLTKETVDFIRECIEDVWNCGPDISDELQPEMLPKWGTYWHKLPLVYADELEPVGSVYVKEGTFDDIWSRGTVGGRTRIQCQVKVYDQDPERLPTITFVREVNT